MEPTFRYSERQCAEALRLWLWNYWEFRVREDGSAHPHHVPPDGCTSIMCLAQPDGERRLAVSGPWLQPLVVPAAPGTRYWGVRCRPEAGGLVLGVSPEMLRNQSQPLLSLSPVLHQRLREASEEADTFDMAVKAMDRAFAGHLREMPVPDPLARSAVDAMIQSRGEVGIKSLADQLGSTPRTLLRRFRAATGLAPKQFARICRFRYAALTLLQTEHPDWAQVASGSGFADQAHMIHEFRELTGLTPENLGERVRKTTHGDMVL